MPLEDFLHRFKTVMDGLMAHPQVRLTHVWIGPGADDEALAKLRAFWKHPLPQVLETLYRQANGVQLRWVDSAHETYDPARDDSTSFERHTRDCLWEVRGFESGLIDFPTIDELVDREVVGESFDDPEPHLMNAFVFESFSESEDAVIYREDDDDPCVVVSSDHLADIDEPGDGALSAYVEHVLSTWGSVWHRYEHDPVPLEALLRSRAALDPTRLVGQRVQYIDEGRGHSIMHGRALELADAVTRPSWWDFAPTMVQVEDDLGETVWVPLRSLHPAAADDRYEALHSDPARLLSVLDGTPQTVFEHLSPIDDRRHGLGVEGGPSLANVVWSYAGLCEVLPKDRVQHALVSAADRLLRSDERYTKRDVPWSTGRPHRPLYPRATYTGLGGILLDALLVLAARQAPPSFAGWLGAATAKRLRSLLELEASRDGLRGYDPLTDASKPIGFLYSALQTGSVGFETAPLGPFRGDQLGLANMRVIRAANYDRPTPKT